MTVGAPDVAVSQWPLVVTALLATVLLVVVDRGEASLEARCPPACRAEVSNVQSTGELAIFRIHPH